MTRLSVVMPCLNAGGTLRRAIEALWAQDAPQGTFEIIVVDDGSTDGTSEIAGSCRGPVSVRVVRQPNRGLASARNRGALEAAGDVLLFMDPDVFAYPGMVSAHLRHYGDATTMRAVQGRTVPDPETLTTPFMRTSNLMPDLTIRRRENLSPLHVVGRNFSITRHAFEKVGRFDEGFAGYGAEDTEMAFRFHQAGGRILYEPEALGLHHHPISIEAAVARQVQSGRAAVRFWQKHGRKAALGFHLEIHPLLLPLKWLVFRTGIARRLVQTFRPWAERHHRYLILNECYNNLLWDAYYRGVFSALREGHAAADSTWERPS